MKMSESKDPAIKLFGKTIKLPEPEIPLPSDLVDSGQSTADAIVLVQDDSSRSFLAQGRRRDLNTNGAEQDSDKNEEALDVEGSTEEDEPVMSSDSNGMKENSKSLSAEEEQNESQDKTLQKPDKILPCPRCNSMDTKFCYFNNYNVNQPRHFCRNCHRYWTAGGNMRNVPIGSGRRKNKCYLIHSSLKPYDNTSLASCDSTPPLCDSTPSVQNTNNGFHGPEGHRISSAYGSTTCNAENHSGGLSSKDENDRFVVNLVPDNRTIPHQMACFPGAPWPYPWNTFQVNSYVPPSAGFSVPYYSAATYWACAMPGAWINSLPASQNVSNLGKRSRNDTLMKDELVKENNPEKNLWVPKTLRIADPQEAAKSSIWSTLGTRSSNQVDPAVGGGLFKAFQPKGGVKTTKILEASHLRQANPAALSRSLTFQEGS